MPRSPCVIRSVSETVVEFKAYDRTEMEIVTGEMLCSKNNMSNRQIIKAIETLHKNYSVVDLKRKRVATKYKLPLETFLQYAEKVEQ